MAFKKYNGPDKYHFRVYKRNGHHPFVVVMITSIKNNEGHFLLSGYMITHDIKKMLDYPSSYVQLSHNPNPKDESPAYLCVVRIDNIPQKFFSKPFSNWHLSKEDEMVIDALEKKKSS